MRSSSSVIWVTGINFERLVRTPEVYIAQHDICLRFAHRNIPGTANPGAILFGVDPSR